MEMFDFEAAGFSGDLFVVFARFDIFRNAGWSTEELVEGLEYLDFLPGIEGLEGEEGVPADLNATPFVAVEVEES